jgi:outer membrane protein TolC
MKMAQSFYATETARSNFYPQLTISATGAFTNSLGSMVANPGQFLANFVGQLVQPIFQNGRIKAAYKVAQIEYEVAEKEWEHSVLTAAAEVSDALVEYNSARMKGEIDAKQVTVLEKNVEDTQELFRSDRNHSYLEVLQAESQLLNAKISKVTDDFNKMQAVVNLYSALGGGRK